jgi:hypothetical protein
MGMGQVTARLEVDFASSNMFQPVGAGARLAIARWSPLGTTKAKISLTFSAP